MRVARRLQQQSCTSSALQSAAVGTRGCSRQPTCAALQRWTQVCPRILSILTPNFKMVNFINFNLSNPQLFGALGSGVVIPCYQNILTKNISGGNMCIVYLSNQTTHTYMYDEYDDRLFYAVN